jgi:DegV family protein with EDD domain
MNVGIVTDSTCDLPADVVAAYGIVVIPAYVNIGQRSLLDGIEISRAQFYEGLPNYPAPPTTAAPAPGAFLAAYERLAAEGVTEIVSVHLIGSLSGLLNAAQVAAKTVESVKVTVFDSRQVSLGLGLLVQVAAELAAAGRSVADIVEQLEARVKRTHVFAVLDTLEYLWRGGRVSWAQFGVGSLLRIKPLLHIHDDKVEIIERVRTSRRAIDRMIELVSQLGPLERLGLLHIRSLDRLDALREQLRPLFPAGLEPMAVEVTPAIGVHAGPGGLGLACVKAE